MNVKDFDQQDDLRMFQQASILINETCIHLMTSYQSYAHILERQPQNTEMFLRSIRGVLEGIATAAERFELADPMLLAKHKALSEQFTRRLGCKEMPL